MISSKSGLILEPRCPQRASKGMERWVCKCFSCYRSQSLALSHWAHGGLWASVRFLLAWLLPPPVPLAVLAPAGSSGLVGVCLGGNDRR